MKVEKILNVESQLKIHFHVTTATQMTDEQHRGRLLMEQITKGRKWQWKRGDGRERDVSKSIARLFKTSDDIYGESAEPH